MAAFASAFDFAAAWGVLKLFLIPIGGGIPGGVVLAREHGLGWPVMAVLYLISDILLALAFEPCMRVVIAVGKRSPHFARIAEAGRKAMAATTAGYGTGLGPLALIGVSFGVDPMTGRAAAVAAGHGFISGWALAILGDMLYFFLLMTSTLWLHDVLGDGTATTVIMLVAMFLGPPLVRRLRRWWRGDGVD